MRALLAAVGLLLGCGNAATPPAPPPRVEVDARAPPLIATVVDAGTGPHPSSGDYVVTTEVVKDTCGDAIPPAPATVFVQMKTWHGELTGNFPLPVPKKKGYFTLRSDIALWPTVIPRKPLSIFGIGTKCLDYETKTLHHVVSATDTEIKLAYTRDFGDASHCPPKQLAPSHCTLDYVYSFTLSKKLCAAGCGVTFKKDGDAGATAQCHCP